LKSPTYVIVDVGDCIHDLSQSINRPEMPTIDTEVVMEYVVDALLHDATADYELMQFFDPQGPHAHIYGENLTQMDLMDECDIHAFHEVSSSVIKVGHNLRSIFRNFKLFEQGFLNYEYGGKINDQTIILRRRRSGDVSRPSTTAAKTNHP
jgi:hypothetical protein